MTETTYVTERGFQGYAKIEDTYSATVRVQASSAAMYDAVWIFIAGGHNDAATHLNRQQATVIRDALTKFIDESEDQTVDGMGEPLE